MMHTRHQPDKLPLILIGFLFIWFFLSSLSIAYHRAPQNDDAMFAVVVKNFLRGEGWATNYGERILFNPDLTAGPALLLPAAPLIAIFGHQSWIPAITGALVNIMLSMMILWQLYVRNVRRPLVFLAFLLSISFFAVNDFKTFTGYYSSSLLFVLSLLLVSNFRYNTRWRLASFGALAAIGLYIKPLILLSFIAAFPFVVLWCKKQDKFPIYKTCVLLLSGFLITLLPWHLYKTATLKNQGEQYQQAYKEYNRFFFEHHGSGIAQFSAAENKLGYLEKNSLKNSRILQRFLKNHLNIPLTAFFVFGLFSCAFFVARFFSHPFSFFEAVIATAITANVLWFVCFSFAATPGHAFFAVFLSVLLLFYLVAIYSPSTLIASILFVLIGTLFLPAHKPLMQAYSFRNNDAVIDNVLLKEVIGFVDSQTYSEPLAGCGYAGAPWRMIYLRQSSGMVVDCYHLLEDALQRQTNGQYQWGKIPDFVLAVEGFGLLGSVTSQAYVLEPMLKLCSRQVLYQKSFFSLCKINGAELVRQLDPARTAEELLRYQQWYRTRLAI